MTDTEAHRRIAAYAASDRTGYLDLRGCTGLTTLAGMGSVGGDLYLRGCTRLTTLSGMGSVGGGLYLSGCTGLTSLAGMGSVGDDLYLRGCTRLTTLSGMGDVGGDLNLDGCTGLTSLAGMGSVGGNLYLRGCTRLTTLSGMGSVGGGLYISGCAGLTTLAGMGSVGGGLDLSGCTGLTSLAEDERERFAVPVVPHIDAAIAAAIGDGGALDMATWHTCETTHCRAGWVIALAGEAGAALERRVGPAGAGALIYLASRPGKPIPDFYASNEDALADIMACAKGDIT
jgi:hypothetical protein